MGSFDQEELPVQFPAGLRIMVVDDDRICLSILEGMLKKCHYEVTTCTCANHALSILRENSSCFDLVLSDVHMPDVGGLKLLEIVGLEMDLPVIMMSSDGSNEMVMNGVKHGACDYLIKPIRFDALKNIWQHVVRKKLNLKKDLEQSCSLENSDKTLQGTEDIEYTSSVNDSSFRSQKKKREVKEDGEFESKSPSTLKKPRVVWSMELHQQFMSVVDQLGIENSVPKKILELMNVPGLTRENVASHLQKYRQYIKRKAMLLQGDPMDPVATKMAPLSRPDLQSLSGPLLPQTIAAIHNELLGLPATRGLVQLHGESTPLGKPFQTDFASWNPATSPGPAQPHCESMTLGSNCVSWHPTTTQGTSQLHCQSTPLGTNVASWHPATTPGTAQLNCQSTSLWANIASWQPPAPLDPEVACQSTAFSKPLEAISASWHPPVPLDPEVPCQSTAFSKPLEAISASWQPPAPLEPEVRCQSTAFSKPLEAISASWHPTGHSIPRPPSPLPAAVIPMGNSASPEAAFRFQLADGVPLPGIAPPGSQGFVGRFTAGYSEPSLPIPLGNGGELPFGLADGSQVPQQFSLADLMSVL